MDSADGYGLNYYGRHRIRFDATKPALLFGREVDNAAAHGAVSWGEVWPDGLTKGLLRLARLGRPLYVTDNGINDASDSRRPAYLLRHIRATHEAITTGADVRGYFHWSLIDNFEWAESWTARFGLIALDPTTQERQIRRSAHVYQQVIRDHRIDPLLWHTEVETPTPHTPQPVDPPNPESFNPSTPNPLIR